MAEEIESSQEDPCCNQITPDRVREITERVYQLWLKDLKIMNERRQFHSKATNHTATYKR